MRVWSVRRSRRPVPWTGAALAVLLAALVHLLGCAHGPVPAGAGHVGAIHVVPTASCGQTTASVDDWTAEGLDPADGGGTHCCNLDEPTVQLPRDITLAEAAHHALPAEYIGALPGTAGERPPRRPDPAASPIHQERARLGVWRT